MTTSARPMCECGEEAIRVRGDNGKYIHCSKCARELRMPDYLRQLQVPPIFREARLDQYKTKCPTDKSLFICGPTGTGKTHFAIALLVNDILHTPMTQRPDVAFTSMINLLCRIRRTFSKDAREKEEDVINEYCNIGNLYIDDIGVEQSTEWALTLVYQIIDHRWNHNKRTVFTSNFDLNSLSEKLDPRISSRIRGMCEVIELNGKDRRDSRS